MKIPPHQIESFRPGLRKIFEDRALAHARRCFPAHAGQHPDEALKEQLRQAVARAQPYHLITEQQIICFFGTMLLLGPNFDSDPRHRWAARVLNNSSYSADYRSHYLLSRACHLNNAAVAEERKYARY